jgi:hypothetical protein
MRRCARTGWPVIALTLSCLAVLGLGTATAATGGTLLLGHRNFAGAITQLSNPEGVPLGLHAPAGTPPLRVDSATMVPHLNAARLDGSRASDLVTQARIGLLPAVQVEVARDGVPVAPVAGVSVLRNAAGDYTVSWSGLSGRALAYCAGLRRPGVIAGESAGVDGSGYARVVFDGLDTRFSCVIVSLT